MTIYQHPAPLLAVVTNFSKSRWVAKAYKEIGMGREGRNEIQSISTL